MPPPSDLTFGVFDAAALELTCPSPILLMCQVQVKANKVFASLIDGGSKLNKDNSTSRYLTRSTTTGTNCCLNGEIPKPGDVVRLHEYIIRRMTGKSEIVFIIVKMQVMRHCADGFVGLLSTAPYPYDTAAAALSAQSAPDSDLGFPLAQTSASSTSRADDNLGSGDKSTFESDRAFANLASSLSDPRRNPSSAQSYPTLSKPSAYGDSFAKEQADQTALPSSEMTDNFTARAGMDASTPQAPLHHIKADSSTYDAVKKEPLLHQQRSAPYAPEYKSVGPVAARVDGQFIEIKNLTPFLGRWVVKGRFLNLGEIRSYSNPKGEGKLWSCDLMDSLDPCGTIRCTFFNNAVDKFHPVIRANEVYTVSRGSLKPANRKFNTGHHQLEIQIGEDANIQHVGADDPTIPHKPREKLVPIAEVANAPKQASVSVMGIILHSSGLFEVTTRSRGAATTRREITLADASGASIAVTMWGKKTTAIPLNVVPSHPKTAHEYPICLVENARTDDFNGRKLSTMNHTDITLVSPDAEEAKPLLKWAEKFETLQELEAACTSMSSSAWSGQDKQQLEHVTVAELRARTLSSSEQDLDEKGLWFLCTAMLLNIEKERQFFWVACPVCGRKLISQHPANEDAMAFDQPSANFCSSCNKETAHPVRKYILHVEIADSTGSLKCQAMADKGLLLMGNVTADYLMSICDRGYDVHQRYEDYFIQRTYKDYVFKIQAKSETYRDETKIRYRIFGLDSLNAIISSDDASNPNSYAKCQDNLRRETRRLLDTIKLRLSI